MNRLLLVAFIAALVLFYAMVKFPEYILSGNDNWAMAMLALAAMTGVAHAAWEYRYHLWLVWKRRVQLLQIVRSRFLAQKG